MTVAGQKKKASGEIAAAGRRLQALITGPASYQRFVSRLSRRFWEQCGPIDS
jgi:hypothetical protein